MFKCSELFTKSTDFDENWHLCVIFSSLRDRIVFISINGLNNL